MNNEEQARRYRDAEKIGRARTVEEIRAEIRDLQAEEHATYDHMGVNAAGPNGRLALLDRRIKRLEQEIAERRDA